MSEVGAAGSGEAEASSELSVLVELQNEDLRADQLRYQVEHHPLRVAQRDLETRRLEITRHMQEVEVARAELAEQQSRLEAEVAQVDARVEAIEQRLRSASAGSFRDQEAMATEIGSLATRKRELEDHELEVMEALEPLEGELASLALEDARLRAEHDGRGEELAAAVGQIETQLDALRAGRAALVAAIAPGLVSEYERLRSRLGGIGVARVVRGACSGCNLALSATELDRIRRATPGSLTHCEQCGRLLVP